MQAAHFRGEVVVARSSSNAGKLIGHDAHSHSRSADQDPAFDLLRAHRRGNFRRVIGIVDALRAFGSEIETFMTELGKPGKDLSLDRKAAVIASDGNFHAYLRSPACCWTENAS